MNLPPANELEQLLAQAAHDPSVRPWFYQLLLDAQLYVLVPPHPAPHGERTLEQNESVSLVTWKNGNQDVVPIFTSLPLLQETIKNSGQAADYLALQGKKLFAMIGNGTLPAVLNPNCPTGKVFFVREMQDLANGKFFEPAKPEIVQQERKILLGQPSEYPQQLVEILTRYLSSQPRVEAAYLAQMADPASEVAPHLIFAIRMQGDLDPVMQQLVMITRESLGANKLVDFTTLGRGGGMDDYFLTQTQPFYQRTVAA